MLYLSISIFLLIYTSTSTSFWKISQYHREVLNLTGMHLDRRLENVRCMVEHNVHDKC